MLKHLVSAVLALSLIAGVASADPARKLPNEFEGSENPVQQYLFTEEDAAGVYVLGRAFTSARVEHEHGTALAGTLYACSSSDFSEIDSDDDGTVDTAANCETIGNLGVDFTTTWSTQGLIYVADIDTAETSGNTSRLTIRGSNEQVRMNLEDSQPSGTSSDTFTALEFDLNNPSDTIMGYGGGYGARPPSGGSAASPDSESDNILGAFYNKEAINSPTVIDQFEHAMDDSWEMSFRSTSGTSDKTWMELNWDLYPPHNTSVLTNVDVGFAPTADTLVTFSGGGQGVVISWDGGTDTLKWRQDFGTVAAGETVTEAAGDGADTAEMGATITHNGITDKFRPLQFVWDTYDHKTRWSYETTPGSANTLLRISNGTIGVNASGSLDGDTSGQRFKMQGTTRNAGVALWEWVSDPESGVTSGSPVIVDLRLDFSADASNDYQQPSALRVLSPVAPGASDSLSGSSAITILDQNGYGAASGVIDIAAQSRSGGAPQRFGHILMRGFNWDSGHIAAGAAGDGGDHLWRDQTNEVWRSATDDAPDSETDGGQLLTGLPTTADPCGTAPEAYVFYNDTSDYYCFCTGAGVDVQMHAPATACF